MSTRKKAKPSPPTPIALHEEKPAAEEKTQKSITYGHGNYQITIPSQKRQILCEDAQVEQEIKIWVNRLKKDDEITIKKLD